VIVNAEIDDDAISRFNQAFVKSVKALF